MALFRLCDSDPLITTLTEIFHANIVRVPEARIQPLCVVATHGKRQAYRGRLGDLIAGERMAGLDAPAVLLSPMADVAGKRSRQVNTRLGLHILDGFLRGFGVPVSVDIADQFTFAAGLSFAFGHVERAYVEPAQVGRLLSGRALDARNPVVATFLQDDAWDCLLIDSVITSRDFSINIERRAKHDFKLNVPAIEALLSSASAQVTIASASENSLTFQGPKPLTFAFSCQRLILDQSGNIIQMPPETQLGAFSHGETAVQLAEGPAMLEWDES